MGMLDPRQLAALEAFALRTLDVTCDITRPGAPSSSATGGAVTTPTVIATAVPARVRPGQTQVRDIEGRLATVIPYQVALPSGQDVQAGDTLTVPSGGGRTLTVNQVLAPRSYSTVTNVVCLEVRYV